MKSHHVLGLVHSTTSYTSEFLHMCTNAEQQSQMNAESTDVGTSLAADPEDAKMAFVVKLVQLALVDGTDTELALDSRDKRRALKEGTSESLESTGELRFSSWDLVVESYDADVLLSGALLRLDKTSGTVDADNQTSSNLGVKGTAVTSLLNATIALVTGKIHMPHGAYRRIRLIQATTS